MLRAIPRLLGGLHRLLLDLASMLGRIPGALHPEVDGVTTHRNGIDERRAGAAAAVARLMFGGTRRVSHALGWFERP